MNMRDPVKLADEAVRRTHAGALSIHGPFPVRFCPGWMAWNVQKDTMEVGPDGAPLCSAWVRVEVYVGGVAPGDEEVRTDVG